MQYSYFQKFGFHQAEIMKKLVNIDVFRLIFSWAEAYLEIKVWAFCENRLLVVNYFCKNLHFNALSTNPTKWSNTLKQFVGWSYWIQSIDLQSKSMGWFLPDQPANCLSVFDYFVRLALKGLRKIIHKMKTLFKYCAAYRWSSRKE